LFYPTAIGWHQERNGENQYGAWMNIMKGHAVANGVYVAAANRIGLEQYYLIQQELNFGELQLLDHKAKFWRKPHTTEEILIAEVDLDLQENVRQNWPFFRDRRIDALETLLKER
jgi:N-carbamoylputrescine amidase